MLSMMKVETINKLKIKIESQLNDKCPGTRRQRISLVIKAQKTQGFTSTQN